MISTIKFSWVFLQSLLDDLTEGLNSFCKDNLGISKVLRFERALLNQQQKKVSWEDKHLILVNKQCNYNRTSFTISLKADIYI